MDSTMNNISENDHRRTTIQHPSMTDFHTGCENLEDRVLDNVQDESYDPNSMVQPMEFGLVTSVYKYKNKNPTTTFDFNVEGLPEEVILHIFKMLDKYTLTKCAFICKKWRRIAYDESLWQCLNIPFRRMNSMTLDHLLMRNIKFLSISYANISIDTEYSFETPLTTLQYLDMSSASVTVKNLSSLLSQCCNLVKLSLENCNIDSMCCKHIGHNTNLEVLNLACTTGLNFTGINHILNLKNLEELNISWAHMEDEDLHYLTHGIMSSIKRLNISGFLRKLKDIDLISVFYRCPQLFELDISDNLVITLNILYFILNNKLSLKVLSVNRCHNFGSMFLYTISLWIRFKKNVPELEELNMFGIVDQQTLTTLRTLFKFSVNKNTRSCIARSKPADNENVIWDIPVCIDC